MIVEHNEDGSESYIVMSNYNKSVIQVALDFIYGAVFNIDKLTDKQDFESLKNLSNQIGLKELTNCLKDVQVEEVSFNEEEDKNADTDLENVDASQNFSTNDTINDDSTDKALELKNSYASLNDVSSNDALNALLSALSQEDIDNDDLNSSKEKNDIVSGLGEEGVKIVPREEEFSDVDDEWESLCQVLTQKRRHSSVNSEDKSDSDIETLESGFSDIEEQDDKVENLSNHGVVSETNNSHNMINTLLDNKSLIDDNDPFDKSDEEVEQIMSKDDDEIIDLTQENEQSSPDMFCESDSETPEKPRSRIMEEHSNYSNFNFLQNNSTCEVEPCRTPTSPPILQTKVNIISPVSFVDELPSPSPLKFKSFKKVIDHNPILPNNMTLDDSLFSEPDVDAILAETPKIDKTDNDLSRKRILSSQDSLNPRSNKKVKSFLDFVDQSSPKNEHNKDNNSIKSDKSSYSLKSDKSNDSLKSDKSNDSLRSEDNKSSLEILQKLKEELDTSEREATLEKLLTLEVTIDDLLQTGIGKQVKKLKNKKGTVGALAMELFKKWMGIVEDQMTQSQPSADVNNREEVVKEDEPNCDPKENDNDINEVDDHLRIEEDNFDEQENSDENEIDAFDGHHHYDINDDAYEDNHDDHKENIDDESEKRSKVPEIPASNEIEDLGSSFGEEAFNANNHESRHLKDMNTRYIHTPPINKRLLLNDTPLCTPLQDYEGFLSPELKEELKKYGLKAVPRKKAILFLKHIYDETHPYVNTRGSVVKRTPLVQKGKKVNKVNNARKRLVTESHKSNTIEKKVRNGRSKINEKISDNKSVTANDKYKKIENIKAGTSGVKHVLHQQEDPIDDFEDKENEFMSLSQCSQQSDRNVINIM